MNNPTIKDKFKALNDYYKQGLDACNARDYELARKIQDKAEELFKELYGMKNQQTEHTPIRWQGFLFLLSCEFYDSVKKASEILRSVPWNQRNKEFSELNNRGDK